MIDKIFNSGIDIHCGGNDLIFPHHENELAQSSAAFENQEFAKYWLHNGMINLSGQKMSKSEGNIKLLNEYIDKDVPFFPVENTFIPPAPSEIKIPKKIKK